MKNCRPRIRTAFGLLALEERVVPTLWGNQLYPTNNPWNQRITNAPVAGNSAAIMSNIVNVFGDGRLHPDFGQDYNTGADLYGIPYNVVHGNSAANVNVVIDGYPDESDLVPVPIPNNVVIEGDYQNAPRPGVDNRGDSHLLIYDVDNNVAYEFYRASRPSENTDGKWHADQQSVWDMKTNSFRTIGWTSADAAGLSILAGLARPDEALPVSQGGQGVINHAIRFTLRNSVVLNQFMYPASHIANPGNNNAAIQPAMGARFRLKANVDISYLNPQARAVAQAMKDYGMIVADNGSNFYFSGASYAVDTANNQILTWNDNDIQDTASGLKSLRFSQFEVVDLTPVVTGLSVPNGVAGTSVTVIGSNFSGAAGRLQVLFGGKAATSVTYVDDGHIVAVAPPGSGTVDVRVVSGQNIGADTRNYMNPIFGYGTSAITPNDRFTYGAAPPAPTAPVITGADEGGTPLVRIMDGKTGLVSAEFYAYVANFRGGVRVAQGDVTGDGVADIVTGPGPGGGPDVRIFDGRNRTLVRNFMAYPASFAGGVYVAVGDVNGDGFADIITGAGSGGGPHVKVTSGKDGTVLQSFFAFASTFTGGVRVAAGNIDADNLADIVVAAGPGGGPHVKAIKGTNPGQVLLSFMAYAPTFTGGVFVSAGDINGDGRADIVTGPGVGGGPHVKAFSGVNAAVLESFFAYPTSFLGGVRVGVVRDVDGDGRVDIVTTGGPGGGQLTKMFHGIGGSFLTGFNAYDPAFVGGAYVG